MRPNRSRIILAAIVVSLLGITAGAQSRVYVTEHGRTYHTHSDCRYLKGKSPKTIGLADIGFRALCSVCRKKDAK